MLRCHNHYQIWQDLERTNTYRNAKLVKVYPSVSEVLSNFSDILNYDVLVTGSLHLVGATLNIIDPQLKGFENNDVDLKIKATH